MQLLTSACIASQTFLLSKMVQQMQVQRQKKLSRKQKHQATLTPGPLLY